MTRYSSDHKAKTYDAIVAATAQRLRIGGIEGVGVASIMAELGLTHGGFYAHFKSRDALLAAALTRLFDDAVETVGRFEAKYGKEEGLSRYADFYLSPRHRDEMTSGCPIPALAGETRRAAIPVRNAFDAGLERLAERLGKLMPKGGKKAALALLGEMAGTLSVSRAIGDAKASNEFLAAKRKTVLA
ncbi:MAG TPA: TetR/AcrR family transcriptional regulator [Hyphomonadaceae bacterium]|nr:TetR/AcrR family transcriptional regulator [Hyphomonadaceae bacterium]